MKNKYFVFSDIHGEYDDLMKYLTEAGFDKNDVHHILVCIGDGFDRGPDSRKVYNLMTSSPRHIYVKGNHDVMFQEALEKGMDGEFVLFNILHNGLGATIRSFARESTPNGPYVDVEYLNATLTYIKRTTNVLQWLQSRPLYYQTKNYIFVHAGFLRENWAETPEDFMLWDIENSHYPIHGIGKTVVIGHHHAFRVRDNALGEGLNIKEIKGSTIKWYGNTDEHRPVQIGNKIAIDGCINYTHKPNILVFEDYPCEE